MNWSEKEHQLLLEGIAEHGIGHWCDIRRAKLREWDEVEIRLKAARLLGKQDLSEYKDQRLSAEQIANEHAQNKAAGEAAGNWVAGVVVSENLLRAPNP